MLFFFSSQHCLDVKRTKIINWIHPTNSSCFGLGFFFHSNVLVASIYRCFWFNFLLFLIFHASFELNAKYRAQHSILFGLDLAKNYAYASDKMRTWTLVFFFYIRWLKMYMHSESYGGKIKYNSGRMKWSIEMT